MRAYTPPMHGLFVLSVWLHVLAATVWVGGMFFLVLVVVPFLRREGPEKASAFMHAAGVRFRTIGWVCFFIFLVTGAFNLYFRGVRLTSFVNPAWLGSSYGKLVLTKLALFALIVALSAVHDFIVGPAATRALRLGPGAPEALALRRKASLMGRANALLALAIVLVAVMLVRGFPF